MSQPKSNFLDVGFDWNEEPSIPSGAMALTYGFGGDDGTSQDIFTISNNSQFTFTAFDLSSTHGVQITDFTVGLKKVHGNYDSPFSTFSGGQLTPGQADPNGRSGGLNAKGTGWGTSWQQVANEGAWQITVSVTAKKGSTSKTWQADPELIVGGKGSGVDR